VGEGPYFCKISTVDWEVSGVGVTTFKEFMFGGGGSRIGMGGEGNATWVVPSCSMEGLNLALLVLEEDSNETTASSVKSSGEKQREAESASWAIKKGKSSNEMFGSERNLFGCEKGGAR